MLKLSSCIKIKLRYYLVVMLNNKIIIGSKKLNNLKSLEELMDEIKKYL
jgi:hypothetical protein